MMELDEAIKHAEEVADRNEKKASWFWGKEGNPNYENCVECAKEHRQLADWLKELKRLREQTRWIPCSERLPEIRLDLNSRTSDTVFVCLKNRTMHMAFYCDDGIWRFCESGESKEPMWDAVIAWMPLSERYGEEDQDEDGN